MDGRSKRTYWRRHLLVSGRGGGRSGGDVSEEYRGELKKNQRRAEEEGGKKSKGNSSGINELSSSSPDQVPDTGVTTSLRAACE